MARRYAEVVQVQATAPDRQEPATFVWRGRLYLVREVLGHWRERRAWWVGAAARVLHGATEPGLSSSSGGLDGEREVWRVEASSVRDEARGVYDLTYEPATEPALEPALEPAPAGAWRLLRVTD